jgi:hypothetical protein
MNTTSSRSPRPSPGTSKGRPNRLQMGITRTARHSNHAKYNNGRREAATPLVSLPCEKISNTTIIIWKSLVNKSLCSMTKSRLTSENYRKISPPCRNYRYDVDGWIFTAFGRNGDPQKIPWRPDALTCWAGRSKKRSGHDGRGSFLTECGVRLPLIPLWSRTR